MFFEGGTNPRKKKKKLLSQNWDRIFEKTRVGFGRTELSLRPTALPSWCFIEWAWSRGLIPSKNKKNDVVLRL